MNNSIYAIYGASGCGRSLMPIARQQLQRQGISAEIYFIDDSLKEEKIVQKKDKKNMTRFRAFL